MSIRAPATNVSRNVSDALRPPSTACSCTVSMAALMPAQPRRLVVGITGATGVIYGVRALEFLRRAGVETHAVASKWALRTLQHEAGYAQASLTAMADVWYGAGDMGAAIS